MTQIVSKVDDGSESFRRFAAHNRALAEELRERVAQAAQGGPEKHRERHVSRGKLLPRDRVTRLLDPGAPFLEIGQLAANGMYGDEAPGAGMIAGVGRVSGFAFILFCTMNIAWIAFALMDDTEGLMTQNIVLFGVNLVGIWQYLLSPKNRRKMRAVKQAVEEFEAREAEHSA